MHQQLTMLHKFTQDISNIQLPSEFTFPFNYTPHKLCTIAAAELQAYLAKKEEWQEELQKGKMFGVLVVEGDKSSSCSRRSSSNYSSNSSRSNNSSSNNIYYLVAFSGTLAGTNSHPQFVPPVYDMLNPGGYFREHEGEISAINREIEEIESSEQYLNAYKRLNLAKISANEKIEEAKRVMKEAKMERERERKRMREELANEVIADRKIADQVRNDVQLIRESQFQKAEFKRFEKALKSEIAELEEQFNIFTNKLETLKQKRKRDSAALQNWLFEQFKVLNANGEELDLTSIFLETPQKTPPAGAGECAAPKLLQYAYSNNLKPIAMAEFWWGDSPKREIRQHGLYYPACKGKCEPILKHMLKGLDVEQDPLIKKLGLALSNNKINSGSTVDYKHKKELNNSLSNDNTLNNKLLEIIYEDDYLLAVNKPSGMLSTPGKISGISVYSIIKELYPEATGPLTVHRLDMNTSGILLIAKSKEVHEKLQAQFAGRQVKKRYIALLEGKIGGSSESKDKEGIINLPLMPDILDRPRQCVDFEHGKNAVTRYKVLEYIKPPERATTAKERATKATDLNNKTYTRIALYPLTGRTHQLRVHCAHKEGLNTPIVGDELYGTSAKRLYLHAEEIEFTHPITNVKMRITKSCDF